MKKFKYKINKKRIIFSHLFLLGLGITALVYEEDVLKRSLLLFVFLGIIYNIVRYYKFVHSNEYDLIIDDNEITYWYIFPKTKAVKLFKKDIIKIELGSSLRLKRGVVIKTKNISYFIDLTRFYKDEQKDIIEELKRYI